MHFTIMNYKPNILLLSFLLLSCGLMAQKKDKHELLSELFRPAEKSNYNVYFRRSTNELEASAALLFKTYKSFLSSQDMNSCVFSPSCSVYAIQAFQRKSFPLAWLLTFDRLSRCHPFPAKNQYAYNLKTGLLYDPLD